ncbi:MAG: hypothetical protein HC859_14370 [Bacteroidia bacterium]|nr:hypothetical protein [Bacteroidia bacterium]
MKQHYELSNVSWRMARGLIVGLVLTTASFFSMAQTAPVKGRVTDGVDNTPLIGANVLIKSTSNGTITDVNGEFALDAEPGSTLIITYIGYTSKEVEVTSIDFINIALERNAMSLNEVVVGGFWGAKEGKSFWSRQFCRQQDLARPATAYHRTGPSGCSAES